jgi:hypothetical protein
MSSYFEQALTWFIKQKVFSGIKKLKQKKYLPFAVIILTLMAYNSVLLILHFSTSIPDIEFIQYSLTLEFFISIGLITSGFMIGKLKKMSLYYLTSSFILGLFITIFFLSDWPYDFLPFQYIRLGYFIIWACISCLSYFFLNLYFFTSFSKKIITMGSSKGHIFFGFLIKMVIYLSIPLYGYMIFYFSIYPFDFLSLVLGVFGIIISLGIRLLIRSASKKAEIVPGLVNFATAIGFFDIYLFYHLIMSFSQVDNSVYALIVETILLLVGMLYLVQNITGKISNTPDEIKKGDLSFSFHSKLHFTTRLKQIWGESGLIIVVMGLAFGYQLSYIESFISTTNHLFSSLQSPGLNIGAIYHRIILLVAFAVLMIFWIIFKKSNKFKEFMEDKYTKEQLTGVFSEYFQKTEDGLPSFFDYSLSRVGKKIGSKFGDKAGDSFDNGVKIVGEGIKTVGDIIKIFKNRKKTNNDEEES